MPTKNVWTKKWKVPGSNGNTWTVAVKASSEYGCSCPVWKFKRQECHHIKLVKMGGGEEKVDRPKPEYILATVRKPTYEEKENQLLIPLVGVPDALMMEATICYYLLKYGYSMGEIREQRRIPREWTGKAIVAHIEAHGETEYPENWYSYWRS